MFDQEDYQQFFHALWQQQYLFIACKPNRNASTVHALCCYIKTKEGLREVCRCVYKFDISQGLCFTSVLAYQDHRLCSMHLGEVTSNIIPSWNDRQLVVSLGIIGDYPDDFQSSKCVTVRNVCQKCRFSSQTLRLSGEVTSTYYYYCTAGFIHRNFVAIL